MQEASFSGLFRTIVYMIGFYYLIRFLGRIFLPMLMKSMVNKAQENFNKQYQSQNPFNQGNSQGKASDSQTPNKESQNFKANPTKQIGDYIDYEEVE